MKSKNDLSPIDAIGRIASEPIGPIHYLTAVLVTILFVTLAESIYVRWPMLTLTLLAGSAAFFGVVALAFQTVAAKLLRAVVPLQREAARLRAELTVSQHRAGDAQADRDRWKSAVEHAAGDTVDGTPTDLIARQALRIRTLERALGQESGGGADGNGGDPS